MVVDGEVLDGKRVKYLTKDEILAKEYKTEIMGLNNWIAAYKGEIDALKHELSVTKHHFDQLRYGPPPEPFSTQIKLLTNELVQLREQLEETRARMVENTTAKGLARELTRRIRRRLASSVGLS